MKTKLLHLTKPGLVEEYDWIMPEMQPNQIKVKTILVGICRSDVGAFLGDEAMPYSDEDHPNGILGTFGHEGTGEVVEVGSAITDVKVGDLVATFSDPAFSYYYYAKQGEYVKIPEVHPRHILQPVASGVNVWLETFKMMNRMELTGEKVLLIGSGFLSMIIAKTINYQNVQHGRRIAELEIVGNANKDFWQSAGFKRYNSVNEVKEQYKVVIDLSSKPENYNIIVRKLVQTEGLVCYASTPTSPITTNFFEACWKALTFILPSPRNTGFINAMQTSEDMIVNGFIDVDDQWTRGYKRSSEFQQGFEDGANRTRAYVRGFIDFRH